MKKLVLFAAIVASVAFSACTKKAAPVETVEPQVEEVTISEEVATDGEVTEEAPVEETAPAAE